MKNRISTLVTYSVLATVFAGALTGCGGDPYREGEPSTTEQPSQKPKPGPTNSPTQPDDHSSDDSDQDSYTSASTENLAPPIRFNFTLAGPNDSKTTQVRTNSLLKIKVKPGNGIVNVTTPGYENQHMAYGCAAFTIQVNGNTVQTEYLKVPGAQYSMCPEAPSEQIIDFSGQIGGSGPITVKVSKAQYDYKCIAFGYSAWQYGNYNAGNSGAYGCPVTSIMDMHSIGSQLEIQVNGTSL